LVLVVALSGCGGSDKPHGAKNPPGPPGRIGVKIASVTAPMARFSRKAGYPLVEPGVLVMQVVPGSAGARAGLRGFSRSDTAFNVHGDEIVRVDGRPVRRPRDLLQTISARHAGDVLTLSVARPGKRGAARSVLSVAVKLPPRQ
jgi:S1-C subfamily serine protease